MTVLTLSANVNNSIPNVAYNDLYLNSIGNIATSYDQQAILEECSQATKTLLGECVLNTNVGLPYQQALWIGVPQVQQFNAALTNALLSINGVLEVVSLITSQGGAQSINTFTFTAVVRTIFGTGVVNG